MRYFLLSSSVLACMTLGVNRPAAAQSADTATTRHLYFGVQLATYRYQMPFPILRQSASEGSQAQVAPWIGVVGYQLLPQLAVQTGFGYRNRTTAQFSASTVSGQRLVVEDELVEQATVVPIQLRYCPYRSPQRARPELLLGTDIVAARRQVLPGTGSATGAYDSRVTAASLRAGFGGSYALTPVLVMQGDMTATKSLALSAGVNIAVGIGLIYKVL